MKPIKLDRAAVEAAISGAAFESDAVVAVFRMVYPNFDDIERVDGFPKCNTKTWKAICIMTCELTNKLNKDRRYDKQVMPGGAWINWGFSSGRTDEDPMAPEIPDWHVIPAPVVYNKPTEAIEITTT